MSEGVVVSSTIAYMPIELRADIVNPSFADPEQNIGIEVVVVSESCRGSATDRVSCVIAPDTERRDTELDPRLGGSDSLRDVADSHIDVVASPFSDVSKASRMCFKASFVGQRESRFGIWVEIVIHMDGIYVVT